MCTELEGSTDSTDSLTPLTEFNTEFQRLANLDTLIPQLCKWRILLPAEIDTYIHCHTKRADKITSILSLLSYKGRDGVNKLIRSLQADTEHPSHKELAQILKREYCKRL